MIEYLTAKSFNRLQEAITFFQTNDMRDFKVMHTDFDKEKDEFTAMVSYSVKSNYPHRYKWYEECNNYVMGRPSILRKYGFYRWNWWWRRHPEENKSDSGLVCIGVDPITFDEVYQIA